MRIGIFGNTNNYPFSLALGLRKLGHDAMLVVNRKERLHRPESKHPEFAGGYPDWILDCSDIPEDDFIAASPRIADVINFLAGGSSGLVLNDIGPSLLEYCPGPAIALMTGSDLTYYADFRTVGVRQQHWSLEYTRSPGGRLAIRKWDEFIARQRAGVLAANAVGVPLPGLVPAVDDLLRAIGVSDTNRDFFYLTDTDSIEALPAPKNERLRILNGARLNWKTPLPAGFSSQDHKGTDVLLAGFAQFLAAGGDGELVMFRKGLHVAETEALANELGIASKIVWRGEVGLREFYAEMAQADVVCDQIGESFPGMVALDAMALGRPVIANFHPEVMGSYFPEPIAACQAGTPGEVAEHLTRLAGSQAARTKAGVASRRFAEKYLSPAVNAEKCLRHLGLAQERSVAAVLFDALRRKLWEDEQKLQGQQ